MSVDKASITATALANSTPTATVATTNYPMMYAQLSDGDGGISQTSEHLLIAGGSIGATILVVVLVLVLYTMRKRKLGFLDVLRRAKNRDLCKPPPPPKYEMDTKSSYEDHPAYGKKKVVFPSAPAPVVTRSASHPTKTPLPILQKSTSPQGLQRNVSTNRSFFDDSLTESDTRSPSNSIIPSSHALPPKILRTTASTRDTRSTNVGEDRMQYNGTPASRAALPAPPTFRQFLSNRPSISQRPGFGAQSTSRFSWTNSNAPQTPHLNFGDTTAQPVERDSFMTQRSSVPRFRSVDSWVNQQSNRVEEQRLKQQFRMTESTIHSDDEDETDQVPEMPTMPKSFVESNGPNAKELKIERPETTTTIATAPIFKAHPGTEVRFSVRSTVPSEVLDMGRRNAAL